MNQKFTGEDVLTLQEIIFLELHKDMSIDDAHKLTPKVIELILDAQNELIQNLIEQNDKLLGTLYQKQRDNEFDSVIEVALNARRKSYDNILNTNKDKLIKLLKQNS